MYNNTLEHEFARVRQQHVINTIKNHFKNKWLEDMNIVCVDMSYGIPKTSEIKIPEGIFKILLQKLDDSINEVIRIAINNNDIDELYNEVIQLEQEQQC